LNSPSAGSSDLHVKLIFAGFAILALAAFGFDSRDLLLALPIGFPWLTLCLVSMFKPRLSIWRSQGDVSALVIVPGIALTLLYFPDSTQFEWHFSGPHYRFLIMLGAWKLDANNYEMNVSLSFYARIKIGDMLCFEVHPGALRVAWDKLSFCPEPAAAP
jgi:hypothetical protein